MQKYTLSIFGMSKKLRRLTIPSELTGIGPSLSYFHLKTETHSTPETWVCSLKRWKMSKFSVMTVTALRIAGFYWLAEDGDMFSVIKGRVFNSSSLSTWSNFNCVHRVRLAAATQRASPIGI